MLLVAAGFAYRSSRAHHVDPKLLADLPRTIKAVFLARSYVPGGDAALQVSAPLRTVTVQVLQAGPERIRTHSPSLLLGVARSGTSTIHLGATGTTLVHVHVGAWASGLYFARLQGRGGWLGFAPFVVRPKHLGMHRVAVVLPTNTWQAYNFRDVDGDADGDTWYADPSIHVVDLQRAFLHRGVPPHFTSYDLGFVRWLAHSGKQVDFLSDDDLEAVATGGELVRDYDLIVFSGHEEYVTAHTYDIVARYRDLGGNLAFLSADNFFYEVERQGESLHGRTRWRDIGRPEARLVGAQYVDWNHDKYPNEPYVVTGVRRAPWLFAGTGLRDGSTFGRYGIEIDARTADSPPGAIELARVPNVFGAGKTAEMTYYETPRGAKVFDAGTINFGGTAEFPIVSKLLSNLWARLAAP